MKVKEAMRRTADAVRPTDSVIEAAKLMRMFGTGMLPVVGEGDQVVGVVTDRDLVVRAIADGLDPREARVESAMTGKPIAVFEDQDVTDGARAMMGHRVRRLIVLDREGGRTGTLSLTDLARSPAAAALVPEVLSTIAREEAVASARPAR